MNEDKATIGIKEAFSPITQLTGEQTSKVQGINKALGEVAAFIDQNVPTGSFKTFAVKNLLQAKMWAVAGVTHGAGDLNLAGQTGQKFDY